MASPNPPEPEFTEPLPEDYQCPICHEVLKEPQVTDCCGGNFCRGCISQILKNGGHCPFCRKAGFQVLIDRKLERKILALQVYCRVKDRGCGWKGVLRELDTHLDTDCQYVAVDCPNGCGERPKRRNLPDHLRNSCPKRKFSCPYCQFKATYERVANEHWPQCEKYPLPCPNDCGVGTVERGRLEHHRSECPLQVVECEFSHSGCTEKIRRKDTARHMEENTQKHLVMVSTSMMSMMKLLQEKDQQIKEQQQQIDNVVMVSTSMKMLFEEKDQQIKEQQQQIDALQVKVGSLENHIHKFTMTEFQKHKTNRSSWTSPSFYTHPGGIGYRICGLCVDPQHTHDHIKVWMNVAKGDFDDQLQWPRACTTTEPARRSQPLHQESAGSVQMVIKFSWVIHHSLERWYIHCPL